ncbi:uncharacterized protein LOC143597257 [Bidens hawaiensis]|uniref:uncharacterized protein LOC143597257 n=1 Tax=Bidens hawaiensis TaxID=980011 RepID=UPI00404AE199
MADERPVVQAREPSSTSLQCTKLTKTNYNTWVIIMESILDAQGLWEVVSGEALYERKNKMARAIIFQALPENVLMQVARTRDAQEIWESLRVRFLGADRVQQAHLQSLKRNFNQLKMGEKEFVEDFAEKVTEYASQFDSLGSPMEDHELVKKLLDSVPDRFIAIVATIEQWADLNTMVFKDFIARLKAFEERIKGKEALAEMGKLFYAKNDNQGRKDTDQDRKNYARGRGSSGYDQRGRGRGRGRGPIRGRGRFNQNNDNRRDGNQPNTNNQGRDGNQGINHNNQNHGRDKSGVQCYNCNVLGHFEWECPSPPTQEANLNQAEAKPPTLMMSLVEVDK